MQDSVFITLSAPLEYGDNQTADQIEIRCPSFGDAKDRKYYRHLQTILAQVIREMSEGSADKSDKEEKSGTGDMDISPSEMIFMLMSAMGDDFHDEVETFMVYANRCCFLDGEKPLKSGPSSRIHVDDQGQLFGSYLVNFIMPGLMKLMHGKD